jgi:hypothetical protein
MVFGRIYTLRSHQTTDIYIGSTTQTLSQRMTDHRKNYKSYLNGTFAYITSYEILQYEDAYIELLFEGEFESKYALKQKEGKYQREMDCVNKHIAGRTKQEYEEEHKEQKKESGKRYRNKHQYSIKQYFIKNKETISKQRSTKIKCECGSTICKGDILKHKQTQKHQRFIQSLSVEENFGVAHSFEGQSKESS